MLEGILGIITFIILNAFLIALFSAPFIIPLLIRSYRLKKLAHEFGLTFESRLLKDHHFSDRKNNTKKNIISGIYNHKDVLIYDLLSYRPLPWFIPIGVINRGENSRSISHRSTVIKIDSETKELTRLSVGEIRKIVENIRLEEIK